MNLEFSFLRVHRHVVELKINKFRTIMQKSDNNLEVDMSMIRIQGGSYNPAIVNSHPSRKMTAAMI
jgi:hypothetical protein